MKRSNYPSSRTIHRVVSKGFFQKSPRSWIPLSGNPFASSGTSPWDKPRSSLGQTGRSLFHMTVRSLFVPFVPGMGGRFVPGTMVQPEPELPYKGNGCSPQRERTALLIENAFNCSGSPYGFNCRGSRGSPKKWPKPCQPFLC